MKALSLLSELLTEELPVITLVQRRCLRSRLNTCDCHLCIDRCQSGALSIVDRQLSFELQKCTGCMLCSSVCPNEAFVTNFDLEQLLQQMVTRKQVVISCSRQKQIDAEEIIVPCLGSLSNAEVVFALAKGSCSLIQFNVTGCSSCVNKPAVASFMAIRKHVSEIATINVRAEIIFLTGEQGHGSGNRRSFLSRLHSNLAVITQFQSENHASAPLDRPKSGRRIPVRTRIIEQIIATANEESSRQLLTLCTHAVSITGQCNNCPRCSGICPTGALRRSGSASGKQLQFTATRCSGCGLCVSFCQEGALTLTFSPLDGR